MNSVTTVATVVTALALLGFFHSANIVPIINIGSGDFCPQYTSGTVTFLNDGDKSTVLYVDIYSKEINYSKSSQNFYVSSKQSVPFSFYQDYNYPQSSQLRNATVYYTYTYKKMFFTKTTTRICNYYYTYGEVHLLAPK